MKERKMMISPGNHHAGNHMDNIFPEKKLGFGLMRLPLEDPKNQKSIDIEEMKKMVDMFLERGFTYFDTAWMYHDFESERAIKTALTDRVDRSRYTLTTKLHSAYLNTLEDRDRIFDEQRKKTGVDYFDYYLIHDIEKDSIDKYEKLHCFEWLADKKEKSLVKHMGFSFHATADLLDEILTRHPEVEFVQLQLNYLDWDSDKVQSGRNYEVCVKHNKPVIVMEPVKGGTLAKVPEDAERMLKNLDPNMSIPSWAVRFAASQPDVKMVLSGMSSLQQMDDNTSYMEDFKPLSEVEIKAVRTVAEIINKGITFPCTGCSYCTPGCPMNIAIPRYFALYNQDMREGADKKKDDELYKEIASSAGKASDCIQCGQCEGICPQKLTIINNLKKVAARFE